MRIGATVRFIAISFLFYAFSHAAFAQIGISVNFGPPPIPIYEQPYCPQDGFLWTPGYWAYAEDGGYYWVPGTWIQPPQPMYLWTPGYWGWGGNAYFFHEGYWGPQVGFYGGINYGYGYGGNGYEGGRWEGNRFAYNTSVNRVNTTVIHNTYNTRVADVSENRVSYNGGTGGVDARATAQQEAYGNQRHVGPVESQTQHVQEARSNPALRASQNQGKPSIAATSRASDFKSGVEASSEAGGEYKAPLANAARGNETRPGDEASKPVTESLPAKVTPAANPSNHASELQPHKFTPPNTGNTATDQKYQQQQDKLAAKQTQDHQKLQQQQENEHQQASAKNYNDAQKQQIEQKHTQQTQQLEQKHETQQKQMEQHQAPAKSAPKQSNSSNEAKPH
ncbi:MAG: hypothetical protein WA823_06655 [Candidatus Acidiferrales bacterium]